MKTIAALFDCDGTLYSAQYGRGLMKYASARGRKGAVRMYYASLVPLLALRKMKWIAVESFHRPLTSRMSWMIKGMSENEFRALSECMFKEYLLTTERKEVIARLRDHQAKGHVVLLVSAQLTPSLEILGNLYKVNGVVGTQVEVKNGCYTGRIVPPVITGADKDRYTRQFFSSHHMDVDWDASYAYADSITDAGLLNMVGHPVAVHPDARLYEMAQSRKWEMIGDRKIG
jgi:putative phosphoserine phosphatase / 1-acylglycerol-3-phosphate O-acyltransferase